jgi:hypothetical protein
MLMQEIKSSISTWDKISLIPNLIKSKFVPNKKTIKLTEEENPKKRLS